MLTLLDGYDGATPAEAPPRRRHRLAIAVAEFVVGGQPLDALSVTGLGVRIHMFVDDLATRRALSAAAASAATVDGLGPARALAALVA